MDSHMEPSTDHTSHEHDPHKHRQDGAPGGVHIGHNEDHHGEKQSMMTKVKAKARKIKDSIREHVGHGHDHDHDELDEHDDDGQIDTDHEKHGTHTSNLVKSQHDEPKMGGRTSAAEGAPLAGNPDDYQAFYPATAKLTPGQDATTLVGSRTDTGRPKESLEHPYAPRSSPADAPHISGGHSTGDLEVGQKGGHVKLGALTGGPLGDVAEHHQSPRDAPEHHHPTSVGHDTAAALGHERKLGERTAIEGISHPPMNKPQGNHPMSDTDPTSHVPGQVSNLREEEMSKASIDIPIAAHSGYDSTSAQSLSSGQHRTNLGERTAMEGVIHEPTHKPHGHYQAVQPTTGSHISGQVDSPDWIRSDAGMLKGSEEMFNKPKHTPVIAHLGKAHGTGAEEGHVGNLGGVHDHPTHLDHGPHALGDSGGKHHAESYESNVSVHDHPTHLDHGPHALGDSGGKHHAESYESNVTDPTGKGDEGIGMTPVLHQLDRMNIHGEPQTQNIRHSQEESMLEPKHGSGDLNISTGSHDQFFPEPVTSETSTFLQTPESGSLPIGDEGLHDKSEQKPETYAGMISSAASMVAGRAMQATNSVTSKLGYGGSTEQQSPAVEGLQEKHSKPGGNAENLSVATAVVADKAVQAKGIVATKLGYGGTHEKQPVDRATKEGSVVETVKEKIAPLYGKAAEVGSTLASKVQGSGTQHEVGRTTTPTDTLSGETDKGVSMKEYWAEKLRPGEDDKALSDVITEALPLHKGKEDVSKAGEEEEGNKVPVKGRVTESEEVARRLGRSEDMSYDEAGTGVSSPGKGVIDRIKDAATSWYQKTGVSPAEDIKDGKEGSSSLMTNEDDGGDGQYKVSKGSVNI